MNPRAEYRREYYRKNREKAIRQAKEWNDANPERRLAIRRRWDDANREQKRARAREHRQRPEVKVRRREYAARYRERNRDQVNAYQRKRNYLTRGAPLDEDAEYYADVLRCDPCAYCCESAGEIDHIAPLDAGADSHWTNLTSACRSCNARKHDKALLPFLLT